MTIDERRARVFSILHDEQCDETPPHPYTDHMPWDADDDEEGANRLADRLIEAVCRESEAYAAGRLAGYEEGLEAR